MTDARLLLGLDAGGSKTELNARIQDSPETTSLFGPAANLQRQGLVETARVLASLIEQARQAYAGATLRSVCAGVAGAGASADQEALATALRSRLGDDAPLHVRVVHDGAIALEGAFEGGSGVIVIAGTGSVIFGRTTDGTLLRAGGWGYLIGDEGSGHALGIHALRAVAAAFDGGPPTRLRLLLAEQHGLVTPEDIIHAVYREGWTVQQAAPLVITAATQGDQEALRIIAKQTHALARQVAWLSERAEGLERRIALLGGLNKDPSYRRMLREALVTVLPGWSVQEPRASPAEGALRLAAAGAE